MAVVPPVLGRRVIQIQGLWWPSDVGDAWRHSLTHVQSIEWAITRCSRKRTAVQAGGNIGLWPRRLAASFAHVITFEPDAISRDCVVVNVPANVEVRPEALGAAPGWCDIRHRGLGSHQVIAGDRVPVLALDSLGLVDLDLLQLDIEGYELEALEGARGTIAACRPLVQVELRGFTAKYGHTDADVHAFLAGYGYREVSRQPGSDVVFEASR